MREVLFDPRSSPVSSDVAGLPAGCPPRNKGVRYPADPPTVEEIVAVMRAAGDSTHGRRLRALIVVLWRAGLRIHEALAIGESDLDRRRGSVLLRRGKGGQRREVGMDEWAWEQLEPWSDVRLDLPVGPLFCVINGATCGRAWSAAAARSELRRTAAAAGVRRRFAPHQLRHAHGSRDGSRGRPLDRHPAPARSQQPWDYVDLPAGHRQRGDHRCGVRSATADGPGRPDASTLKVDRGGIAAASLIARSAGDEGLVISQ